MASAVPAMRLLVLAALAAPLCGGAGPSEPRPWQDAKQRAANEDEVCLMQRSTHVANRAQGTQEGRVARSPSARQHHAPAQRGGGGAHAEGSALAETRQAVPAAAAAASGARAGNGGRAGGATVLRLRWAGIRHSSALCPIMFIIVALSATALIATATPSNPTMSLSQADLDKVFDSIDTDRSGTLSVEEVKIFIQNSGHAIPDNQITSIVKMADKDDSGDLDSEEFAILLQNLGDELPKDLRRCLLAEFVGMFLFQFFGGMPDTGGPGNALIVVALLYLFAPISGAHFNPAVTVAAWMARQVTPKKAALYIAVNMLAAIEGVLLLQWIGIDQISSVNGLAVNPCTAPAPGMQAWEVMVLETLSTFTFIMVFLAVAVDSKSGWGNVGPLALGITLIGLNLACSKLSGLSMNPARFLAPCIVYGCFPTFWETVCYIAAALIAAAVAASLYLTVFFDRPTPEQHVGMSNFQFMLTDNSHLKRVLACKRRNSITTGSRMGSHQPSFMPGFGRSTTPRTEGTVRSQGSGRSYGSSAPRAGGPRLGGL